MNRTLLSFCLSLLGLGAITARADQADDAIVAMTKLSTATSYRWDATLNQNSHTAEMHGKTVPEGFSLVTFVGYAGGSVSGANAGSGGKINTVFLGDSQYVLESNGTWLAPSTPSTPTAEEPVDNAKKNASPGGRASTSRGGRTRGGAIGGAGGAGRRRSSGGGVAQDSAPANTSLRLPTGLNLPHEQLAVIAANYADLHAEDGGVSGKLTQSGAELLVLPPGSMLMPPKNSAGTFRLWIKDGAVSKYELKLKADSAPDGTKQGAYSETITVELADVGATKVDVPPAAKKKLGV